MEALETEPDAIFRSGYKYIEYFSNNIVQILFFICNLQHEL